MERETKTERLEQVVVVVVVTCFVWSEGHGRKWTEEEVKMVFVLGFGCSDNDQNVTKDSSFII